MTRGRRRPAGQGSVFRRADGRWEGRYSVVIDGRRVQRSVYGALEKEAVAKLAAALSQREAGQVPPKRGRLTVSDWLDNWLADCQGRVRPTTAARYADIVRNHLRPRLGDRQLAALTPQEVNAFLTAELASGLAPRTVAHLRAVLRTALTAAMAADLVIRNAAELARSPKVPAPDRQDWTACDVEGVLSAVAGTQDEAPVAVSLLGGLRQGEVLGLRWGDVDLEGRVLWVHRALQRLPSRDGDRRRVVVAVEPKSRTSRRRLPINDRLARILASHRAREEAKRVTLGVPPPTVDDYLFTSPDCGPLEGTALTKRLAKHLVAAGLPVRTWHDLRHGFASRLADAGVDLLVISRLLGHSGVGITANTYTRDPRAQMLDAVGRLG
jgi:integrase